MSGIKTRIGDKTFGVKQGEAIEVLDASGTQIASIKSDGSVSTPSVTTPVLNATVANIDNIEIDELLTDKVETLANGNTQKDENGNYKTEVETSTGDLVTYYRVGGAWEEVLRYSRLAGDEAIVLKNRGIVLGKLEGSAYDTELVIGARGDSSVVGMTVLTSDDDATFTDVSEIAASSTGSTYKGFSDNPIVGATDYIGWDYGFCNFKLVTAVVATVDGSSAVVREYWNGSAWTSFPVMVVESGTNDQRANNIGTVVGTEQIRFDCPQDFAKTTVNGIEKYWIRLRVTGALLTAPSIEQIKVGTDRFEVEYNGRTSYYGSAEYTQDLSIPFRTLYNLVGSTPGNANITVSPNITIAGQSNLFSGNAKDGKTGGFNIPRGLDTSRPIEFSVIYAPSDGTAGDIEFELVTSQVKLGDVLDGTLDEVSKAIVVSVNNEQNVRKRVTFSVDVQDLLPGDSLAFSFYRDATGTNPDDTYTGNVVVSLFSVRGTFFTP